MATDRPLTFADVARPAVRPDGAPKYSDVILSSRWPRPMNANDPYDTFEAARAFHATRIDWLYLTEGNRAHDIDEFVAKLKAEGYHVTGALNSKLPDTVNGTTRDRARVLNAQGEPVALPWLPGSWNGDPTDSAWREIYLTHALAMVEAGVDALQNDDPGYMFSQRQSCHTATCLAAAGDLGHPTASTQFKIAVTRAFYEGVFAELDARVGRHVPQSANNFRGEWEQQIPELYELFDYGMAEIDEFAVAANTALFARLRELGKPQIFTFRTTDVPNLRRFIAHTYAVGGHMIAPWDVYAGSGVPRLYVDASEVADLYGFARAMAPYLDGYEDAAVGGYDLQEDRYAQRPIDVRGGSRQLSLFVRAKPGEGNAPIVIHCLDVADDPQPATVRIRTNAAFGGRPFTVSHLAPAPYDAALHDQAESDKDCTRLVRTASLDTVPNRRWTEVAVPASTPWSVLVLEPES